MVAESGVKGQVRCETCGTIYEVDASELSKYWGEKSKKVTKTKRTGPVLVREPEYKYYAKKVYCPHCKRTIYAEVLNINEITGKLQKSLFRIGIRTFIQMAIGGFLIMMIMSIPIYFLHLQNQKKVEELKRQQYEEIKDRYGF